MKRHNPFLSLGLHLVYAVYHWVLGFSTHSWWWITLGCYYILLSTVRAGVLLMERKRVSSAFIRRAVGVCFLPLTLCIVGVLILSVVSERGVVRHEIVMITIALYTFCKITMALVNLKRASRPLLHLSLADALVSVYALQRSMLVSFPGMAAGDIRLFNLLTGTAVCLTVCILGINLIGGRRVEMAKSKLVKANEKIAETVTGGYKKVETAVVDGYTKIEDKFVAAYLTREGETVEEAKARLKNK